MEKIARLPLVIVDDDLTILRAHRVTLEMNGWDTVRTFSRSEDALDFFQQQAGSLLILDVRMPGLSGFDLAKFVRLAHPEMPVVVVSGVSDVQIAIEFMKLGCFDYLIKPVDQLRFLTTVQRALEFRDLRNALQSVAAPQVGLSGKKNTLESAALSSLGLTSLSQGTLQAYQYAQSLSEGWEPILVRGETGTGKDVTARAIHQASGRTGEFIPVNISGLDDALFSDTLFGHARGAYTHAEGKREGLIGRAKKGTLFLDEIGDLDPKSQIKLLRLLENREYYPLGSDVSQVCEARILMATHRNLEELVDSGLFRKDLYYRISTFQVFLPPLRERIEDIPYFAERFLLQAARDKKGSIDGQDLIEIPVMQKDFLDALMTCDFPGNIRELRSVLYRCYTKAVLGGTKILRAQDLSEVLALPSVQGNRQSPSLSPGKVCAFTGASAKPKEAPAAEEGGDEIGEAATLFTGFEQLPSLERTQEELITEALRRSNWNKSMAARMLGVTPQALHQRLKRKTPEYES